MFRRRRRGLSFTKIIGLIIFTIGIGIFFYIIPFKLWIFIFAFICMAIGILLYNF